MNIMKDIMYFLGQLLLGFVVSCAILAILVLCIAMPDILDWLSQYIGELCTWLLFLLVIGGIIAWSVSKE